MLLGRLPERAALSRPTVGYHLRKVITKLDASSRSELAPALPARQDRAPAATPHD